MNKRTVEILIHTVAWAFVLISPLTFVHNVGDIRITSFLGMDFPQFMLCITFYINYLYLVPRYLLQGKHSEFLLWNVLIIAFMVTLVHLWMSQDWFKIDSMRPHQHKDEPPLPIVFIIRDVFLYILDIGIASTIRLSIEWNNANEARKEAELKNTRIEKEKTDAELKTLRNQINPHFLLNTLNNIYALIAMDSNKAQEAVMELSKMLRHILYDNQNDTVNLTDEVKFLKNYINLMRIRLQDNVKVNVDIDIPEPCNVHIAPLIFISLIENAFKHGISPTLPSFIKVHISANTNQIICEISNSNHPKTTTDVSGHGIGLEQVKKRLDISYAGRYEWTKGTNEDGSVYTSQITITI